MSSDFCLSVEEHRAECAIKPVTVQQICKKEIASRRFDKPLQLRFGSALTDTQCDKVFTEQHGPSLTSLRSLCNINVYKHKCLSIIIYLELKYCIFCMLASYLVAPGLLFHLVCVGAEPSSRVKCHQPTR